MLVTVAVAFETFPYFLHKFNRAVLLIAAYFGLWWDLNPHLQIYCCPDIGLQRLLKAALSSTTSSKCILCIRVKQQHQSKK